MEAFFKTDEEILEWVDLFIEKLFTVNLLSGNDADSEFIQGRQAVEKIVKSFHEMFDVPKDILVDGIRQLVEQRLPDHRVIENFPDFYLLMNSMIYSGLENFGAQEKIVSPQHLAGLKNLQLKEGLLSTPSSKVTLSGNVNSSPLDSSFSLRSHLLKTIELPQDLQTILECPKLEHKVLEPKNFKSPSDANCDNETVKEEENIQVSGKVGEDTTKVIVDEVNIEVFQNPAPVTKSLYELIDESVNQLLQESQVTIDEYTSNLIQNSDSDSYEEPDSMPATAIVNNIFPSHRDPFRFNTQKKRSITDEETIMPIVRPQQVPLDGKWLSQSLRQFYPVGSIEWNLTIDGYQFLAKIDNLLVHILTEESLEGGAERKINDLILEMKKKGYQTFTCYKEDLEYPRRLERGIRRAKR